MSYEQAMKKQITGDKTIAIEVQGLSKAFGNRTVLRKIDFQVAPGESVALKGANGAGKTTLLRCLAALTTPTAGVVRWFGERAAGRPRARRHIGVVGHDSFLYPHLTLRENLVFAARLCDVSQPARRADQLLDSAGLRRHADRLAARISRGMRQRLTLVRAMVHDPPILLLDEPFSGLDAEGTDWLLGLLLDSKRRGRTLCFATHARQTSKRLADRVLHLHAGRAWERAAGDGAVRKDDLPALRAA